MNLKKIGKVFTSKFVGTGPSSYKKEFTGPRLTKVEKHCCRRLGCGKYFNVDDVKRKVWYGADVRDQFEQCSSQCSRKSGREATHRYHCPIGEHQTRWGALCEHR